MCAKMARFHKRKHPLAGDARNRTYGTRELQSRILIICEDEKSAKFYLEDFCKDYGLEKIVMVTTCPDGNDPLNIVNYAKREANDYDKAYCVFDNDRKQTPGNIRNYKNAVSKCNNKKIIAITSMPGFEYWLLLHYNLHLKPFEQEIKCTVGEQVESELKKHFPSYSKGARNVYNITKKRLDTAMANANKIIQLQAETASENPLTKFHILIGDLKQFSKNSLCINT